MILEAALFGQDAHGEACNDHREHNGGSDGKAGGTAGGAG